MADLKISELTNLTAADPANDMIPIVDVSATPPASGSTKRISINNILACSPSATLASATITGDLTVDTSTLFVNSTSNAVCVGTLTSQNVSAGRGNLTIGGTSSAILNLSINGGDTGYIIHDGTNITFNNRTNGYVEFFANGLAQHRIAPLGVFSWYDGAGGTRMTLNSTGLGVGASPAAKLHVSNGATVDSGLFTGLMIGGSTASARSASIIKDTSTPYNLIIRTQDFTGGTTGSFIVRNGSTDQFQIDSSGNVGVGVTPSAWGSGFKYIQAGPGCSYGTNGSVDRTDLAANWYYNGGDKYINATGKASIFQQSGGAFFWLNTNTASGGAGSACSLTTAMTLDASGNLLVGTTSAAGVRLDVQTTTGNCIGRVKSNAAASTASFIIDYVETLGCTYIKKAGSDVWIYGVQNDTSATPNFKINTSSNVGVQLVAGATAWTTLSDETVKDIIEPISNAVAKVGSIRSVIGKFKTDDSSKRRSFLIAQDVQSVLPEAVDVVGENNELGLRYTEVIPLLVAAIKELTAEVNAQKNA